MHSVVKGSLLFFGALAGGIIATAILHTFPLLYQDIITQEPSASNTPITQYYKTIIILLLALLPLILFFTYSYVKGASEEKATDIAQAEVEKSLRQLRYELHAKVSEQAWQMSDFLSPVIKEHTERYLQEVYANSDHQISPRVTESSTIQQEANTIAEWIDRIAEINLINHTQQLQLKEFLNNYPETLEDSE